MSTTQDERKGREATVVPPRTSPDTLGLAATVTPSSTLATSPGPRATMNRTAGGTRATVLPPRGGSGPSPSPSRYESMRTLGAGGMGEVDLVRDHDIGRTVAVKRPIAALDDDGLSRFAREVRTIGRLEHPGIVPIHDVGLDEDGRHYFVMKYVEGETLGAIVGRLAAKDPASLARYTFEYRTQIFMQLLQAVKYAHAQGVLHRDIKPDNIMVGPYGEVMLMDWGIARELGASDADPKLATTEPKSVTMTENGALLGTPAYMSPEQARGEIAALDVRSDVYALSVLFYELLVLRHYLPDKHSAIEMIASIGHDPDQSFAGWMSLSSTDQIPPELIHFLRRGMHKDPRDRFQDVDAMLDELGRIRDHRTKVQCHLTFLKRSLGAADHLLDRHPALMTFLIAAALALIVYGGWAGLTAIAQHL